MQDSDNANKSAEFAMGVVNELAHQGGLSTGLHSHGNVMKTGELLVKGAAKIAPGAVAVVSTGTIAAMSTASATVVALAPIVTPIAAVAAVGYGVYRLVKWIDDK